MAAYYNDNDPKIVVWLRELIKAELIADGEVDDRSIVDVQPGDLRGFVQCHFFAGIGGWSYALRLSGWPDDRPAWSGSSPCQNKSSAARGRNVAPELHAPFQRLIAECRPRVVFGEQVASRRGWLDEVADGLEVLGYAFGAVILPAYSVGQDHARERIFFVGDTDSQGQSIGTIDEEMAWLQRARGQSRGMVPQDGLPGRVDLLRGFGNAIVPQVAAAFIGAYLDAIH